MRLKGTPILTDSISVSLSLSSPFYPFIQQYMSATLLARMSPNVSITHPNHASTNSPPPIASSTNISPDSSPRNASPVPFRGSHFLPQPSNSLPSRAPLPHPFVRAMSSGPNGGGRSGLAPENGNGNGLERRRSPSPSPPGNGGLSGSPASSMGSISPTPTPTHQRVPQPHHPSNGKPSPHRPISAFEDAPLPASSSTDLNPLPPLLPIDPFVSGLGLVPRMVDAPSLTSEKVGDAPYRLS